MAAYIICSLACAFAPNIGLLILFRFTQGFAASAGIVISRAIARDLYSGHELTKFFSLLLLVGNLGLWQHPSREVGFIHKPGLAYLSAFHFLGIFLLIMTKWSLKETHPIERRIVPDFKQQLGNYRMLLVTVSL